MPKKFNYFQKVAPLIGFLACFEDVIVSLIVANYEKNQLDRMVVTAIYPISRSALECIMKMIFVHEKLTSSA